MAGAFGDFIRGRTRPIAWNQISPNDIQQLAEESFDAANVPEWARRNYYRAFHEYIYGL